MAFDVHNEFGRLLDERSYQDEIATRCRDLGLTVSREVEIRVTHEGFVKTYFIDLVLIGGVPVDTKTVEKLNKAHVAQLLNYLFLTGTHHGSLINLRHPSVERQFVSTRLTVEDRQKFQIVPIGWKMPAPEFQQLRDWMRALLDDWGAFLDFRIYRDAITHFLGGPNKVILVEVEFFLRLHGLWEGLFAIPPPPDPPFDVETMEPIRTVEEWCWWRPQDSDLAQFQLAVPHWSPDFESQEWQPPSSAPPAP